MNRLFILIPVFIILLTSQLVRAADTIKLEEVVVTATRNEAETEKLPSNITVISQEEISQSTARTVQDLLRNQDGLIVRDLYGTGTQSTVDIRGFGRGLDTAILIDGRKVNEIDLSGVDWNLIPLENVERIEIVRGGGSVLYGDNALAGVINIITKKGVTLTPVLELDVRLESYRGNSEHFSIRGATERLGYFLFMKHRDTEGYRDNSEFNAEDINAHVTATITDSFYLELRGGYHTDHQGLPGGLTRSELEADRRQTTEPHNGVDYEQYYYGAHVSLSLGQAEVEADYNFNSRQSDDMLAGDIAGTSYNSATDRDTDTDEVKLKVTARQSVFNRKNVVVTGIDYYRSDVANKNVFEFFGASTTVTDLKKTETGLYIHDEFFLDDRWTLTAGYRYTKAEFEDRVISDFSSDSGRQKFNESAVKAGLAFNYTEGAKVFAGYSKGFRLPTTDELFAFDGTVVSLKGERSDTFEAGVVHPFSKNIDARFTAYLMNVEDELFLNPAVGFFGENQNIDRTRHQGVEVGFSAGLNESVSLNGNLTYTEATFESGIYKGKNIPLIPRYRANLGAEVSLLKTMALSIQCNWTGNRLLENDVENTKEKLPSYLTADVKLSYRYKKVTAYIGVNNVFNKKYSEFGAFGWSSGNIKFYPSPERHFYGGIRIVL
jgi:iron complex outermembrane receptor protein